VIIISTLEQRGKVGENARKVYDARGNGSVNLLESPVRRDGEHRTSIREGNGIHTG
jgi:hypothetical protein